MASTQQDYETLAQDFAHLRKDFSQVVDSLKDKSGGVSGEIESRLSDVSAQIADLYKDISGRGQRSIALVGETIEQRPLTAILIAFALGFIGSKLLERR